MFRITASLADGIPVDLRDTLTGLDDSNIQLLVKAVLWACGGQIPTALSLLAGTHHDGQASCYASGL